MTRAILCFCCPRRLSSAAGRNHGRKTSTGGEEKHLLRYRFEPGETVRWQVVHLAKIRTTVSGTTQTAETVSKSVKAWKVVDVDNSRTATFEHVEQVDMQRRSSPAGRR